MRLNHSIWKRALAVILAVSMCGQSVPAVVSAGEVSAREEVSEEDIQKEENEDAADMASLQEKEGGDAAPDGFVIQNGVLTDYTGAGGDIVIPEGVTEIGAEVFLDNSEIASVGFPSSLTKIGESAFRGCLSLGGELTLPEGITEIGSYAFSECPFTGDLTLPDGLKKVSGGTFAGCGFDGKLTLPEGISAIGSSAFYGCSFTGILTLPEGLKTIGEDAFSGGQFEGKLTIPDSVTDIWNYAFEGCAGLTEVAFGAGLTDLSDVSFYGCGKVESVRFLGEQPPNLYGTDYPPIGHAWMLFGDGCLSGVTSLWVPEGCRENYRKGFGDLPSRVKIREREDEPDYMIQNGVLTDYIGRDTEIVIPEGVTEIGPGVFGGNVDIVSVIFPAALKKIGERAFSGCSGLDGNLTLPEGLTEIGSEAFSYCSGLDGNLALPEGLTKIGSNAFSGCKFTGELTLPKSLTEIGRYAFRDSLFTGDLVLPPGLKEISDGTFQDCGFDGELILPESIVKIGDAAFKGCPFTGDLDLPESIVKIGDSAFNECPFTGDLYLPESLTEIGPYAFRKCPFGGELILPEGLTKIGMYAFYECKFTGDLVLPSGLQEVSDRVFVRCGFGGKLVLPEGLTKLSSEAVYGCQFTGDLTIPSGLQEISAETFWNCGFGGKLVLSEGLKKIGENAFFGCSFNGELVLPGSIEDIDRMAFRGCNKITSLRVMSEAVPKISGNTSGWDWRSVMSGLKVIYVPPEALTRYQSEWGRWVTGGMTLAPDPFQMPVANLRADAVYSKSAEISWDVSAEKSITGYYVYRNGQYIADVEETSYADAGLEKDMEYTFQVSGHTADGGVETPKASVSIHTANPAVTEIYTAHEGKRIGGGKGELKASVRIAGRLADYTGHFSYREKDGSSIQIGDVVTDGARLPSGEAEYRILWNAAGLPSGEYQVTFALTDPDGGKGLLEETVIVDNSIPERISRVTAVGDLNKIVISWSLSHEIATKKYAVYRRAEDEEEFTKIREVQGRNTVSCEDTDVKEDVKYYYYVTGISDFGLESEASEEAAACRGTDAENPRVVQITPVKGSVIGGNTEFCARAADNVAVVRTELYRSEDGQSWTHLHTEEGAVCRYEWNVKENGGTGLWIKAAAYDAAGNAGTAIYNYTVDKEGPAQVQGLSWESTSSAVTLKWQDVPDPDLAFFRVEQKQEDGSFTKVRDVETTLGINILNLKPDTAYTYRVAAYDRTKNRGADSEEITARTAEDVTAPIITQISPAPGSFQDTISLTVTASDDVAVAEILLQTSGNRIFWDDLEKFSFQEDKKNQTVSYALDLSGYEEGPLYVRAVAKDRAGHEGNSSGSAPYVEYRIDRTAPSAPENFRADFRDGALFLAWDLGGEEDLYDYILYRSDDGGEFREIKTGLRYTSCYDRDAKRGETYAYQLAVRDQAGNVSKRTEAVTASVPEDEKPPELVSFLPDDGSVVGAGSDFYLLAKDNDELDIIEVSYQVNHGTSKNLLRQERIKNYYKEIETKLPFDELMDGIRFR